MVRAASTLPGFIPVLCGLPIWIGLRSQVEIVGWAELIAVVAVGLASYVFGLLLFATTSDERGQIKQWKLGWLKS